MPRVFFRIHFGSKPTQSRAPASFLLLFSQAVFRFSASMTEALCSCSRASLVKTPHCHVAQPFFFMRGMGAVGWGGISEHHAFPTTIENH